VLHIIIDLVLFAHCAQKRSMVTDVNVHSYYLCAMCAKMALGLWHYGKLLFIGLLLFEHCAQKWVSLLLTLILRKLRKN
jgi:hypothetical protein